MPRRIRTIPPSHDRIAILIALTAGPLPRATIRDRVQADSVGSVHIKLSTLYVLLAELESAGYIKDPLIYELTQAGWSFVRSELARIEHQRQLIRERLHF